LDTEARNKSMLPTNRIRRMMSLIIVATLMTFTPTLHGQFGGGHGGGQGGGHGGGQGGGQGGGGNP